MRAGKRTNQGPAREVDRKANWPLEGTGTWGGEGTVNRRVAEVGGKSELGVRKEGSVLIDVNAAVEGGGPCWQEFQTRNLGKVGSGKGIGNYHRPAVAHQQKGGTMRFRACAGEAPERGGRHREPSRQPGMKAWPVLGKEGLGLGLDR